MPDLMTLLTIFIVAVIAAVLVAWLVGHVDWLAKFVNVDQA